MEKVFSLLQQHTIDIYKLKNHRFTLEKVKARSLLSLSRFDLLAKLFYIRNMQEGHEDVARKVYLEHIKAFNPDAREPGRDDKTSYEDFLSVFDQLITYFRDHDFDAEKSVVPVGAGDAILDGAHRIAALAYWDKDVTVARFADVEPVAQFDYAYFRSRGLPQATADTIAAEALRWKDDILVACVWPRIGDGKERQRVVGAISVFARPYYQKSLRVPLKSFVRLIASVYRAQPWVGTDANHYAGAADKAMNCYGNCRKVTFVFFECSDLKAVLELKDRIRGMFTYGKHSLHITDNQRETEDIARLVLTPEGMGEWLYTGGYAGRMQQWADRWREFWFMARGLYLTRLKVAVYRLVTLKFLRK